MAYEVITLNLIPSGEVPVIHAAQYDVDRPLRFALKLGTDDFDPTTYDLELQIRKVDNNIVTVAPASVSGNVVTFNSTEQMTACSGTNLGEIQITKDDLDIATLHFYLVVQRDVLAGGVTSETAIHNLTSQIAEIVPQVMGDDYYTKDEVDEKIAEIPTFDPTNYYDKSATDALLDQKADVSDLPDMSNYYNKNEVDTKIFDLYQIKTVSGDIGTLTDGGDNIPVKSFECEIGDTGFSQANIVVCGKNFVSGMISGCNIDGNGIIVSNNDFNMNYAFVKKGVTYYTNLGSIIGGYFSSIPTLGSQTINQTRIITGISFTAEYTGYFAFRSSSIDTIVNLSLNSPITVNTPYNGTIYTVEFGSTFSAGTLIYENGAWSIDVSGVITPITSSTRVKTISGENNIFSTTGDCEVDYFTDKSDGIAELIKAFM